MRRRSLLALTGATLLSGCADTGRRGSTATTAAFTASADGDRTRRSTATAGQPETAGEAAAGDHLRPPAGPRTSSPR